MMTTTESILKRLCEIERRLEALENLVTIENSRSDGTIPVKRFSNPVNEIREFLDNKEDEE